MVQKLVENFKWSVGNCRKKLEGHTWSFSIIFLWPIGGPLYSSIKDYGLFLLNWCIEREEERPPWHLIRLTTRCIQTSVVQSFQCAICCQYSEICSLKGLLLEIFCITSQTKMPDCTNEALLDCQFSE